MVIEKVERNDNKMKKILFICAMEKEAKQIAEKLEIVEIENNIFENSEKHINYRNWKTINCN